jgi:predicted porin
MNRFSRILPLAGAVSMLGVTGVAQAIDFTTVNKDWTFSVSGNVNVHYIYSSCEGVDQAKTVAGGLACTGSKSGSSVSNVGNGLLPAAINFGVATQQEGYDIAAHFGFYPGVDTNDGGSPNNQAGAANGSSNTALGTTGLDVRQVYMTFGNKDMGTFLLGRNFGLFGFDAIINDMTIPGVGVAGSMSGVSPANTSLGSIGLGYIYTDTLAQMDYTTPDFAGFKGTLGIFDPINSATNADATQPKKTPGVHGKLAYTHAFDSTTKLYASAAFIDQKQNYISNSSGQPYSYNGFGADLFVMADWNNLEAFGYYYHGSGLGTTGLFVLSDDGAGHKRSSNGYLAQVSYKIDRVKLGVNYGESRLNLASGETAPALVQSNSKVTGGVYYSLTRNLTLLSELSDVRAKAHDGDSNHSLNFNVGAFLSF